MELIEAKIQATRTYHYG